MNDAAALSDAVSERRFGISGHLIIKGSVMYDSWKVAGLNGGFGLAANRITNELGSSRCSRSGCARTMA